ncbi:hypothetical protein M0812_01817 [Anaeramoeba flamelloides]|uniref:Uncharacterized protein n=1 Tax=Anaeramoeba flamelloides TaxID=1746091 RepID=A0AAV7Z157_9EUKA|nr:hypothetical protein M0812_01817 [Anaeramoeba flamelloides]
MNMNMNMNMNTNTKIITTRRSSRRDTRRNLSTNTNMNMNMNMNINTNINTITITRRSSIRNRNAEKKTHKKTKRLAIDLNKIPQRKRLSSQIENNNQIEQFNTSLVATTNQPTFKTKPQNEEIRTSLFGFLTQKQNSPLPQHRSPFVTTYKREPLFEETNKIENKEEKPALQKLPLIQPEFLFNFSYENGDFFGNNFEEETNLIGLNDIWY